MTFPSIPGSFKPGAATTPQPVFGSGSGQQEAYHLQFLTAEERQTAILMGYFQDARLELEGFIRSGDLSVSDATFYRQLLDETNRVGSTLNSQGATWVSNVIPEAHSAGWRSHSSTVVNQGALAALSRDTLSLITATTNGIRQTIRQAIAQGILQGLSGADVRARILASGLTNIPHWPTVEYRAGVIARTETMKAYNTGAVDGLTANGASFVEWITSPDEAVCPICIPRDGVVFTLKAWPGPGDSPYPGAQPLPHLPAHPRCRCTIRARYRDKDGNVIRQGLATDPEPKLPTDAMGGNDAPTVPPAAGDMKKAFGKLALGESDPTFWRSLGRIGEDDLRALSLMSGKTGNAAFGGFLRDRFGIAWPKSLGWNADLRLSTLRALERIREIAPRYVTDSEFLHTLGARPVGAKNFSRGTIARAFASGHVEGNMKSWAEFGGVNGRKLRAGIDVDAAEEVILHEFIHTVHNRYGLHDAEFNRDLNPWLGRYVHVEAVDAAWHAEYKAIRSGTIRQVASPTGDPMDAARLLRRKAKQYREDAFKRAETPGWDSSVKNLRKLADGFDAKAAKIEADVAAGDAEFFPTEYSKTSYAEDFAESGMLYFLNPSILKRWSPKRYAFMRNRVFGGIEP